MRKRDWRPYIQSPSPASVTWEFLGQEHGDISVPAGIVEQSRMEENAAAERGRVSRGLSCWNQLRRD